MLDPSSTFVALVHHPVRDRQGRPITSALTTLDLHDIARSTRTYGLGGFFVVHPAEAQRALARRILDHWLSPEGAAKNDHRRQALETLEVVPTIADAARAIQDREGRAPLQIATAARKSSGTIGYRAVQVDGPALILLGTGGGLADEALAGCPLRLDPIEGPTDYNHLSVRSACAIVLDRLFGVRQD
jgi:hypothetical protein